MLAYDARGHGESGGLIGIEGPNEISDVNVMFAWLRDRPTWPTRIRGLGISYGGARCGTRSWRRPVGRDRAATTWTNLAPALVPQGLAKSGVLGGFLNEMPLEKFDPSVIALRDAAFSGNLAPVLPYAAARSSIQKLAGVKTPVFFMQGRRDFAFGLDQVLTAWPLLKGPKHLWIGLHGHAPSTFPAPDTSAMLLQGRRWFDRYLLQIANGIDAQPSVEVAPVWKGRTVRFKTLPLTTAWDDAVGGRAAIGQSGKIVRQLGRLAAPIELFGVSRRCGSTLSPRAEAGRESSPCSGRRPRTDGRSSWAAAESPPSTAGTPTRSG